MSERGGDDRWLIDQDQAHGLGQGVQEVRRVATAPAPSDVYADLKVKLGLRTRLPVHQRRVARARDRVREAMAHGPCAIMVSGGKDSTVVLHLAREVASTIPAFFIDCGAETPWTYDTLAALQSFGHSIATVETAMPLAAMFRQVGWRGYDGPERLEGDWHYTSRDLKYWLIEEPSGRIRDMGYPVSLLGLRGDESRGRAMRARRYGWMHRRNDGAVLVAPIIEWEGDDVLAYIVTHDLPLSPVYLQPDDQDRASRRTAAALLSTGAAWGGSWSRLREQQPAFWQEIVADFPEMRRES